METAVSTYAPFMQNKPFALLLLLLLLAACTHSPAPPPEQGADAQDDSPLPVDSRQIGNYAVRIWNPDQGLPTEYLPELYGIAVIDDGIQAETVISGGVGIEELPVVDLTGEGEPDVLIRTRSGGSHCCGGVSLYNLGETPELVLSLSGGFGSLGGSWLEQSDPFVDLNDDGRFEIMAREGFTGLFCTVPQVKIVLAYEDGRYRHVGDQYPEQYQPLIQEFTQAAETRLAEEGQLEKCDVLELILAHLYVGESEMAWAELERLYTASDTAAFRQGIEEALAAPNLFYHDLSGD